MENIEGQLKNRYQSFDEQLRGRISRINAVNKLIEFISDTDRKFFFTEGNPVAHFSLDKKMKLYFVDYYTQKKVKFKSENIPRKFSHGGGLWQFISALKIYIETGIQLYSIGHLHWGYSESSKSKMDELALMLGITEQKNENR